MKNKHKHTKTTVSLINYHFVLCPRYRRKIFNIPGVEQRFKELTRVECNKCGIDKHNEANQRCYILKVTEGVSEA